MNVELASPADFIPLPGGWRERSLFVTRDRFPAVDVAAYRAAVRDFAA